MGTSTWINYYQTNNTLNGDGTVNYYISQTWNNISSTWINNSKATNTYNSNKQVLTTTTQTWTNNNWVNSSKMTNFYNGSGNQTGMLMQSWDMGTSTWINYYQTNNTLNGDGTVNYYISQTWNNNSNTWINNSKGTYSYIAGTYIHDIFKGVECLIYPNPTKGFLFFNVTSGSQNINQIEIYSISGTRIKTVSTKNNYISVSDLSSGQYIVRFIFENYFNDIKFIKN
jgi:hypothetical protein